VTFLLGFGYLLATFPLIAAMAFAPYVAERRQKTILEDLKELLASDVPVVKAWGANREFATVEIYYSRSQMFWPTFFLSSLYHPRLPVRLLLSDDGSTDW
jgi:hypothetical protein